jgi:superfamily II helicase
MFLENYKEYLSNILNILNDFLSIIPGFNDKFISICQYNLKYADNDKEKLFQIFNSFLDCIIGESKFSFYFLKNTKNEYLRLLQKNRNKYETILNSIDKKYSLPLYKIDIFLYIVKNNNDKFLEMTIKFFKNNFEINEEYIKEEKKIINNDKILLKFIIKQNKINNKNDIFNIFNSNEKFFKYSQYFFGYILNEYIDKKSPKNNCKDKFLNIPNDI